MSQAENSFKNSLKNFKLSRNNNNSGGISLPTSVSPGSNSGGGTFSSLRDSASNAFSNVTNTVQGYIPLGGNAEEEEEPWYQLSRVEVKFRVN